MDKLYGQLNTGRILFDRDAERRVAARLLNDPLFATFSDPPNILEML
jgi:hypothetical protein